MKIKEFCRHLVVRETRRIDLHSRHKQVGPNTNSFYNIFSFNVLTEIRQNDYVYTYEWMITIYYWSRIDCAADM